MADYMAISVWGYCFIRGKGTPRPEIWIKQDTFLTPFLCPIANVSMEDEKRRTILKVQAKVKTAFIRAFALIFALIPYLYATASDFEVDGLYYNILSEEDRTVEVTHKSNHSDENENYVSGEMEIPRRVLYNKKTYTVTAIGMYAFCQCTGLTSVTIPSSVTSIGDCAFFRCSGLTSMTIPNSVTSIGETAFGSCTGLTAVTIPNSVTSIRNWTFSSCTGLTSVTISKSVTSIGNGAFMGCSGLTSMTLPNSVTSIGESAFSGCDGLTSVTIPNSVISIGGRAFEGCTCLAFVTIGNSVTSIGGYAFIDCTGLKSVTIPNSVTSIGEKAFWRCTVLASVTIGNSVTFIGDWAFGACSDLTSVTIPNSVTSIGYHAFNNCTALTSVTIGNSVASIGDGAFGRCWGLQTIYVKNQLPVKCTPDFPDDVIKNAILYVPTGTLAVYEKADPWRNFWNIEEMDFSGIEDAEMDTADRTDEPVIRVENGVIKVDNADGEAPVEVFDISGKSVFRECANMVSGLAKGIYIVKAGDKVQKIRL